MKKGVLLVVFLLCGLMLVGVVSAGCSAEGSDDARCWKGDWECSGSDSRRCCVDWCDDPDPSGYVSCGMYYETQDCGSNERCDDGDCVIQIVTEVYPPEQWHTERTDFSVWDPGNKCPDVSVAHQNDNWGFPQQICEDDTKNAGWTDSNAPVYLIADPDITDEPNLIDIQGVKLRIDFDQRPEKAGEFLKIGLKNASNVILAEKLIDFNSNSPLYVDLTSVRAWKPSDFVGTSMFIIQNHKNRFQADYIELSLTGKPSSCKPRSCSDMGWECGSGIETRCNKLITCSPCETNKACSDNKCIGLSGAEWTDLEGILIDDTGLGATVLMQVEGENIETKSINYTIEKQNSWFFGLIKIWTDLDIISTKGYQPWTPADIGVHTFTAKIINISLETTSGDLDVLDPSNPNWKNNRPIANITNPKNGYRCSIDKSIAFEQESRDPDDPLKITWDFDDGSDEEVFNDYIHKLDSDAADTTHVYTSAGVYNVELEAKEMTRNQQDTDAVRVLIFQEGINVVPIITEPDEGVGYGNIVRFIANKSFVSNCSKDRNDCPLGIDSEPKCDFIACDLYCYYIHAPGQKTTEGYTLNAEWTFPQDREVDNETGEWEEDYNDVVEFVKFFPRDGEHQTVLDLEYLP